MLNAATGRLRSREHTCRSRARALGDLGRKASRRPAGGAEIFDAHTHIGDDIDGMRGRPDELLSIMDAYGIAQAFTFCMDEPDRHPAFSARERPHARVDGGDRRPADPVRPARPRRDARSRRPSAASTSARAASSSIPGRRASCSPTSGWSRCSRSRPSGACRSSSTAAAGCRRSRPASRGSSTGIPEAELIIAHAGIADMAGLAHVFGSRAGVFFDTSAWSPVDLLDFYRQVSPEQVLYASDYPYGQQPSSLLIAVRTARAAGFDDEQLRDDALRKRAAHRHRRAAARAHAAARIGRLHAADDLRPHPRLPLDGDAAALDAPTGHVRRARARPQRVRGAERRGEDGGARADPRADRLRDGPVEHAAGHRGRPRAHRTTAPDVPLLHVADIVAVTPGA